MKRNVIYKNSWDSQANITLRETAVALRDQ